MWRYLCSFFQKLCFQLSVSSSFSRYLNKLCSVDRAGSCGGSWRETRKADSGRRDRETRDAGSCNGGRSDADYGRYDRENRNAGSCRARVRRDGVDDGVHVE